MLIKAGYSDATQHLFGYPQPWQNGASIAPASFNDPSREVGKEIYMSVALSAADIKRALTRISHEILEKNQGASNIVLLGIPTRGAHLAQRIAAIISEIEGSEVPHGTLDITLFRDDLRLRAPKAIMPTTIPQCGIEGRDVILVDDVLFSGRTIRSALDALGEIGRPRTVQLAALVDRGHRELPIKADFVGKNLPTSKSQSVRVLLGEIDGRDEVSIEGADQ
jgi:pyrimidine operon attenuation protein / uracil phosphoribosyltransferase